VKLDGFDSVPENKICSNGKYLSQNGNIRRAGVGGAARDALPSHIRAPMRAASSIEYTHHEI
jgi:hypothetical protein